MANVDVGEHRKALELAKTGNIDAATDMLRQALSDQPDSYAVNHDLAVLLATRGSVDEAIGYFQKALEIDPHAVDCRRNLALAHARAGRTRAAIELYRDVVRLQPDSHRALFDLGASLRAAGEYQEAVEVFNRSLQIAEPAHEVHHELGLTYSDLGRLQEARQHYEKCIQLNPDYSAAYNNLGVILQETGELDAAVQVFREALARDPESVDALNNLGVVLSALGQLEEAVDCYRRALSIKQDSAQTLNNLGNTLRSLGEVAESVLCLKRALQLRPDYAEAHNNIAIAYVQQRRYDEALENYDCALYYKPDYPDAHMNRALSWLSAGEFERGWNEYEWRWRSKESGKKQGIERGRWDGSPIEGRTILLRYEQGLGDTFQFIRYARLLKRRGARVVADVQRPLVPLMKLCPYLDEVAGADEDPPAHDVHAPLLSLPAILETTLNSVPAEVPYLQADTQLGASWRDRLQAIPGYKVAIAWQGNPRYRSDRQRSIPLRHFESLSAVPDVQLISLQTGLGTEQASNVSWSLIQFESLDSTSGAFMDTAAIMSNVDLVITSDTSIPHLAGALGVDVWLLLPYAADWRWMRDRDDSPWYPTMKLYRQRQQHDWDELFQRVAGDLRRRIQLRRGNAAATATVHSEAERIHQEGVDLTNRGRFDEAVEKFRETIRLAAEHADGNHNLGVVFAKQGRFKDAIEYFRQAIAIKPDFSVAFANLGLAYLDVNDPDAAAAALTQALHLSRATPETHFHLGVAEQLRGRLPEATRALRNAVALRPQFAEAHCRLASVLLAQERFAEGWVENEWRHALPGRQTRRFKRPRWDGRPFDRRTLLLYSEDDLRDSLLFIRYAHVARQLGSQVIVECEPELAPLLARCPGVDRLVSRGSTLPDFDFHCPLLSVPFLIKDHDLPAEVPYVFAEPELVENWAGRLGRLDGVKIGIAWSAPHSAACQFPLEQLRSISRLRGAQLISLQAARQEEVRALEVMGASQLDPATVPLSDLAALICNLDLVITSDGIVAQLAGALGITTWVALPHAADWRWFQYRDDSPWYPSVRLFRQRSPGNWDEVFDRMSKALAVWSPSTGRGVSHPVIVDERPWELDLSQGSEHLKAGRLTLAVNTLRRAAQAKPDCRDAHLQLGLALMRQGRSDEAAASLRRAVELDAGCFDGWISLGRILLHDNPSAAIACFESALKARPDAADVHTHLGVALAAEQKHDQAQQHYLEAIRLDANSADAHNNLGNIYRNRKQLDLAKEHFERALSLKPDNAEYRNNLGILLNQLGQSDRAAALFREAIRLRPQYADAYNNLGVVCADLNLTNEARSAFQHALFIDPDRVDTHRNLAMLLLIRGDFEIGWREYEWRRKSKDYVDRHSDRPEWNGSPLSGATVLIWAEQGLGDTIQFVRYARELKRRGNRVILECQPPLAPLLAGCDYIDRVVPQGAPSPEFDVHVPILSLPSRFRTGLDSVPNDVPYLAAEAGLVRRWQARLAHLRGFKVGIAWQGSKTYAGDRFRSIPLEAFRTLAELPDVALISLQKGLGEQQLEQLSTASLPIATFPDLDEQFGAFMDTAAIMQNLDLVITSDTAIPHLAGALGVPTWMALPRQSDWRWMRDRDDSPWYPTMRLFRQGQDDDWHSLFQRLATEVRREMDDRAR